MDILEANVPHMIPRSVELYQDQQYEEFSADVEAIYNEHNRGVVGGK